MQNESVASAFDSSGLSNITTLESSRKKIGLVFSTGIYRNEKFIEEHVAQLEAFLNDCIDHGQPIPRGDYSNALSGPLWETYCDFRNLEDEMNK